MDLDVSVGVFTMSISVIGAFIALKHFFFFSQDVSELSNRVRLVFLSDALIYLITLAFGIWAFFEMSFHTAATLHWIRVPLLLFNIYASIRLYRHYKHVNEKK